MPVRRGANPFQRVFLAGLGHAIHGNQDFTVLTREPDFIDSITHNCGYVLNLQGRRLFHPGDSVLTEEHLELNDIDVLFVGPADLSHSMAIPGRIDEPIFDEAVRAVAAATKAAGKAAGVPVYKLLGGAHRTRIRVYANGWYTNPGTPEQNAEAMGEALLDALGQRGHRLVAVAGGLIQAGSVIMDPLIEAVSWQAPSCRYPLFFLLMPRSY